MIFRKISALLLAGMILASAASLSGCNNNNNNNNNSSNETVSGNSESSGNDASEPAVTSSESEASQSSISSGGYQGNKLTAKAEMLINQLYGSAGCIYLCKKNNISLEDSYINKIKDEARSFMSGLELSIVGSSELVRLICTDHVLSLGMKDKLSEELHRRYNESAGLFDEYFGDTYEGLDEDTKLTMQMASTDSMWIQFNSFGINDDKYDIKKLLADSFNKNISKYDHNDIYNGVWTVTSELENIFYYFLITDSLDDINYKPVWDVLGPNYLRNIFDTNANVKSFQEKSIANISGVLTDYKAHTVLGADITPKYTAQEYYNILDSDLAFLYNSGDEDFAYFEYTLFVDLSQPSDLDLKQNKHFTESVQKWLKHCYENHGKVENAQ